MKEDEKQLLRNMQSVEALYEKVLANGNFATMVKLGSDTQICLLNRKVESVVKAWAESLGYSLRLMRSRRQEANDSERSHMDYLELSPGCVLMPLPYCKPFNSNHGSMAFLNVTRIVRGEAAIGGRAQVRFLSGSVLPVRLSLKRLREKISLGKRIVDENYFAVETELRQLRLTIRRIQRQERDLL